MEESAAKRIRPTVSAGGAPTTQWWSIRRSFSGMTVEECLSPSLFTCQDRKLALPHYHSQAFRFYNWPKTLLVGLSLHYHDLSLCSLFLHKISLWRCRNVIKMIARYPENIFQLFCYPKCCINRGYIVTDMVIFAAYSGIRHRVVLFVGASIIEVSPYMSGIV